MTISGVSPFVDTRPPPCAKLLRRSNHTCAKLLGTCFFAQSRWQRGHRQLRQFRRASGRPDPAARQGQPRDDRWCCGLGLTGNAVPYPARRSSGSGRSSHVRIPGAEQMRRLDDLTSCTGVARSRRACLAGANTFRDKHDTHASLSPAIFSGAVGTCADFGKQVQSLAQSPGIRHRPARRFNDMLSSVTRPCIVSFRSHAEPNQRMNYDVDRQMPDALR